MTLPVDVTSEDFLRNPAAGVERLRAAGPIVEAQFPIVGKVWITTTQEAAGRVLKDSENFTLRKDGKVAGMRWWMPRLLRNMTVNMLTTDEPDHTRLRSIVDEAFRRRAILEMEPRILAIAEELAGELFAEGAPADLVQRYARILPLAVICELLGLPTADRPKFMGWVDNLSGVRGTLSFIGRLVWGLRGIRGYIIGHFESVRASGGEGLIAELIKVEQEVGKLNRDEMVAMVFLLLFAGHETTMRLISGSVYELLKNPALRDWLEQDWSRADLGVEEFLRFVSPVQFSKPRFVGKDMQLFSVPLKRGDRIMAMITAANYDPAANEQPEVLDLTRHPNRHIAFGTGIHFCLGHQLARIEARCALKALFTRWPKLALGCDPSEIKWRPQPGLRAIRRLPVVPE